MEILVKNPDFAKKISISDQDNPGFGQKSRFLSIIIIIVKNLKNHKSPS